jgi:guanosine-3',5'-bis(diphosphate) 3'-pyrophosphohydrolase
MEFFNEYDEAKLFAMKYHNQQKYGIYPYVYHLDHVAILVKPYGNDAQIIAYLHDLVEDTEITIEDIQNKFGLFISECVDLITDCPGKNRKERKLKTYKKLSEVQPIHYVTLIVKVADRLSNVMNCIKDSNKDLLEMYRKEDKEFTDAVYRPDLCTDLWRELKILLVC